MTLGVPQPPAHPRWKGCASTHVLPSQVLQNGTLHRRRHRGKGIRCPQRGGGPIVSGVHSGMKCFGFHRLLGGQRGRACGPMLQDLGGPEDTPTSIYGLDEARIAIMVVTSAIIGRRAALDGSTAPLHTTSTCHFRASYQAGVTVVDDRVIDASLTARFTYAPVIRE